ncbi:LysR family transcriptional regulator [Denitrificimonas sp. JX-1]|uniref:LysR family transcriptional regulator n=1 Tax=Denitrificimonas halotolerans TaxID=3098930 RepID=A0ABU5GQL5_9GAMM|nr:LysR family transcriptional regulator [Denitrificimonas sp. JX-1]MDY7218837.1 LysR family transcriptional regulator [Denitrificimonas sp. JX-1]
MDLANLQTFITIAEQQSFSLAGERLHVTQPAISKRIASLEDQLGVRLFDRIGREIRLTEAGQALLPRAYRIVNELEDARRALNNLHGTVSGNLSLATSHHIGLRRLPPLLRAFTKQYPEVMLDIRFLDSEVAYTDILHGRCELAIITLSPHCEAPLKAVKVWQDDLDFVVALDHPLAQRKHIRLVDLCAYPAVFPGSHTFTRKIALQLFDQAGLTPEISMSTNYMETIKMMVSIGLAWSVLPHSMLDESVVRLPISDASLSRDLGYIVHTERTLSNAAQAFMQMLNHAE